MRLQSPEQLSLEVHWVMCVYYSACVYHLWFELSVCRLFGIVSNEVPEQPVISPVSGCIYERRLIEKYVNENGTDPMNGEKLDPQMLVEIKSASYVVLYLHHSY